MENINFNHIHFIGIGGIGMSGIAEILLALGYEISGSDAKSSSVTQRLGERGARIIIGQKAENVDSSIDLIVRSTAIKEDNPEIQAALSLNIPIIHRAEMLAFLMMDKKAICIAGAHGKTTTSSMIALLLDSCGIDPTIIIGGELKQIGSNAKYGNSDYLVAEADESDASFLKLSPWMKIITNIEEDHLDHYKDLAEIQATFIEFIQKSDGHGIGIYCLDCPEVAEVMKYEKGQSITYGFHENAQYQARNWRHDGDNRADIYENGVYLGELVLQVPGKHNMTNGLAAVTVGRYFNLDFAQISQCLAQFSGAKRRFQLIGEAGNIKVIDDYAHHPTEIQATIEAARSNHSGRLLVAFQPHRYSRTKFLAKNFAQSLRQADKVFLTEVYSAGEDISLGAESDVILTEMSKDTEAVFVKQSELNQMILKEIKSGDMVLMLGAGSIWQNAAELAELLKKHTE